MAEGYVELDVFVAPAADVPRERIHGAASFI
jgi:hypothetical protein